MPAGRKRLGEPGKVKSLLEAVQKYKNFKQMAQFNVVSLKARSSLPTPLFPAIAPFFCFSEGE